MGSEQGAPEVRVANSAFLLRAKARLEAKTAEGTVVVPVGVCVPKPPPDVLVAVGVGVTGAEEGLLAVEEGTVGSTGVDDGVAVVPGVVVGSAELDGVVAVLEGVDSLSAEEGDCTGAVVPGVGVLVALLFVVVGVVGRTAGVVETIGVEDVFLVVGVTIGEGVVVGATVGEEVVGSGVAIELVEGVSGLEAGAVDSAGGELVGVPTDVVGVPWLVDVVGVLGLSGVLVADDSPGVELGSSVM